MSNVIPTFADISPTKGLSLDEKVAVEHFLGKSVEMAQALFKENSIYYAGDIMWMGTKAFAYYFPAFASYLVSEDARGDADALNSLVGLLTFRSENDPESINLASRVIDTCIDSCLAEYEKFSVDAKIYGDLRGELLKIRRAKQANQTDPQPNATNARPEPPK